jgi:hypothetical protein
MLRRIPLLVDTAPKPKACVPEDFTAGGRRRVFHGGTMGFARGAPLRVGFKAPPFLTGFNLKQESRSMVMMAASKNRERVSLDNILIYLYIFQSSLKF